jgi:hypothetical protein
VEEGKRNNSTEKAVFSFPKLTNTLSGFSTSLFGFAGVLNSN